MNMKRIQESFEKKFKGPYLVTTEGGETCFMGQCLRLHECFDEEAKAGKWGKCLEFKEGAK